MTDHTVTIASLIILHLLCWAYAFLVEYTRCRWEASKRYTFAWVVGGVMMTVVAASFTIGLEDALLVGGFFVASGLPMSIGAMIMHTWLDDKAAKKRQAEAIRDRVEEV